MRRAIRSLAYLLMWWGSHASFKSVFSRHVRNWEPDVIHCHDGLSLPLCAQFSRSPRIRTIYDSHELEAHRNHHLIAYMRPRIKYLEKKCLPKIDAIITVGEEIADHLSETYGIARPSVLFNSPVSRQPNSEVKATVRTDSAISEDATLVVYTGNIAAGRGLEDVLYGLRYYLLHSTKPVDVHFSLVGTGRPETKESLRTLSKELGLENRIQFHEPVLPDDVSRYITDADIAVLPIPPSGLSHQYAMPNKLFEAANAGLPILATKLKEMNKFIAQHQLGRCYEWGDAKEFSQEFSKMIASLEQLKESTQKQIGIHVWEIEEAKLLTLYEALSAKQPVARVAMVVPNPCDPDYRVTKEAESLARAGYEVRVFCTMSTGTKKRKYEVINGVEYFRLEWSAISILRSIFS